MYDDYNMEMLLADANGGDVDAQFAIAERFRKRAALDIDDQQAFTWYRRAAGEGHPEAQFRLARCYAIGRGVVADPGV